MRKRDLIIEFLQLITGVAQKAAPRFELGIKDLQSSALPLGHAAMRDSLLPSADRISQPAALLFISNGHGEDLIALRVLEAIHKRRPLLPLSVLPLVGEGKIFYKPVSDGWLKLVGPSAPLPSGGFSNQSLRGLLADFSAGLTRITLNQWQSARMAAKKGFSIVAVGDILPLLMAWGSGAAYSFIGTPKSDYTWCSGPGYSFSDWYHRLKGSEWDPWECALMRSKRCKMVAARDLLTARGLRRHRVKAFAPGNPMMDSLRSDPIPSSIKHLRRLLLLCGSRMPEAAVNFERLLASINLIEVNTELVVLVPLAGQTELDKFEIFLKLRGFSLRNNLVREVGAKACWAKQGILMFLGSGKFSQWAAWGEIGLANAGTATEQIVGLGIPALSLPGKGPQFKEGFAKRQSRLLGGAVIPCKSKNELADRLQLLLNDVQLRNKLAMLGSRRMGKGGGSDALAILVERALLQH